MKKNLKKNTKVFMFETPVEDQNKILEETNEENNVQFPRGLLYLDAILKQKGYEVLTKDYTAWSQEHAIEKIKQEIMSFSPEFIGITVMSMTRVSTYAAIRMINKLFPKIKIILGGIHSSIMYKQLILNLPIAAVCIGESEDSFPELLEAFIKKRPRKKIKGIAFKEKGKVIVTEKRPLEMNLDKFPFPNYDLFMNPKIKNVSVITSRGCPSNCSFCCLHAVGRRIWRPRDYKKVVDEIEFLLKKFPWIETIEIGDDTSTLDNNRMVDMCKEIIKRKIKVAFRCQGRIKPITREMLYWMEKAGFNKICFGIETGSEKLLKSTHKGITRQDCINTFKLLSEFKKIEAVKFLIVGFPGETEQTVNETIDLVKKLQKLKKMEFFYATPLWIYPGTEVYEIAKSKGKINDDYWLSNKPCPLYTVEHSRDWLFKMSNKIVVKTMLAQGKLYFLKRLIEKLSTHPKYYIKRVFRKTSTKGI